MNTVSSKVISLRGYTDIPMMVLILKTFLDSSFRISIKVKEKNTLAIFSKVANVQYL